ncbi:sensor histidine kinase [Massilia norwichensis]|jgi:Histidine kinase|uniref:Histidine kinase n=1 Tax=Massilia norwichensis TaxID=1442366 RepID=A0ABT2A7E0_9BURK|nr:histidine kinase [Massilia norwichensis]MCS0589740.1 histidine kinase [Massilia norwichensis]
MTTNPGRAAHPLDMFALFRRWPASTARNLVYTALWSSALGVFVSGCFILLGARVTLPIPRLLGMVLLTSNTVGFLIHGGLALLRRYFPAAAARRSPALRLCQMLVIEASVVIGFTVPDALLRGANPFTALLIDGALAPILPMGIVITAITMTILAVNERRMARETATALQQQQIAEAGRLLAEARLRTLQAQIEPHFLYNTLSNVVSLIGSEPARAKHMLERLIDFLRASLSASRAEQTTLGAELDLAGAYLDLLAVRMGARLRWRIEAHGACRDLQIAPMLIQPLVENAVMHGIEPKLEGGEIVVRAACDDGLLRIDVSDDGMGLGNAPPRPGGGVGLSNLRERLRSLHGNKAQLQLFENQAAGVTSRLLIPLSPTLDPA